ncbi:hypothetical protein JCM9279_001845 [Rhodotorula babjevae]
MSTQLPPRPTGLAAPASSSTRPLPHFTSSSLRPSRAPLPPAAPPSARPARKESLRAQGPAGEAVPAGAVAADPHDAQLEAVLENRRRQGVPTATARPARQPQPAHVHRTLERAADEAHWGAAAGENDDLVGEREVLRLDGDAGAAPASDDVALSVGKVDLSRMTSTRRYMAELDEDDEPGPGEGEGDRATWHSGAWESEARDSIASLEPLQSVGYGGGARGRSRLGPPRDSALTLGSVDGDPFSYSVYATLPSPRDSAYVSDVPPPPQQPRRSPSPQALVDARASGTTMPVVRIGPPSPTTDAYLQNPHDSALWSEVTTATAAPRHPLAASAPVRPALVDPPVQDLVPPPSLSQSTGRVPSQVYSAKNFSRPFVAHSPAPATSSSPVATLPPLAPPRRRPSSPRLDAADATLPSPLDRSSSLGHDSLFERSSSIGHSSQTSHSTHMLAWGDAGRARLQDEAKRAIALARGKSQRAVAGRDFAVVEDDEPSLHVGELREVDEPHGHDLLDAYDGEAEVELEPVPSASPSQSPIASFPHFAPPPSISAYSASEYRDSTAQYAAYAPDDSPQPHQATPSPLGPPPPAPLSPATPTPFALSPSSPLHPHPPSTSPLPEEAHPAPLSTTDPSAPPSPPRPRNVLRKQRPPPATASDKLFPASAPAMARSFSSESAKKEGVWSRFRSRSRSRGASERPDPALWAQERPPVPALHGANDLIVSGLSNSLPASSQRFLASPSPAPSARTTSPAPSPALSTASAPMWSAPLSQTEFARLAAARPAFPHRGASARSAPEAEWVLKNVEGARTVQAGMVPAGGVARTGILRGDDDEMEHLSEVLARPGPLSAFAGHGRAGSGGASSLYSDYSLYSLPASAPPASPAVVGPSPPPQQQRRNEGTELGRKLSTLRKLDSAIASRSTSRPSIVGRTASGKEIRREPVTPDDYLQLGIDLHERGELERAAWCFEQSARKDGGCGAGMLMYGLSLRHGWGCQVNAPLGFRFLQMAAESVVADLDRVVFGGRTLSEAEANTKAAKSELVLALHEIGASYRFGWGVDKSKQMAVSYFRLAADLGDVDAQQDLAFALANGKGCKKDLKEAARFYRLAIAQGAPSFGLSWVYKDKYVGE